MTCLSGICTLDYENIFDCLITIFVGSSLPFPCWLLCMLLFYLCDDHQFIDESKCERYPWSTGERRFRCL